MAALKVYPDGPVGTALALLVGDDDDAVSYYDQLKILLGLLKAVLAAWTVERDGVTVADVRLCLDEVERLTRGLSFVVEREAEARGDVAEGGGHRGPLTPEQRSRLLRISEGGAS